MHRFIFVVLVFVRDLYPPIFLCRASVEYVRLVEYRLPMTVYVLVML